MYCATCGTAVDLAPEVCPSCSKNPLLDERYRLINVLGQGAHGTTWRAEELSTGSVRTIKELPLRLGVKSKSVDLFRREAEVLQQLHHDHIPTCHEVLDIGAGKRRALYIVMDFVDGESLQHELRQHRYTE
ncbi:MAG: serine/threonine protein kinase, partial [Kiritimatiellia bacterium]